MGNDPQELVGEKQEEKESEKSVVLLKCMETKNCLCIEIQQPDHNYKSFYGGEEMIVFLNGFVFTNEIQCFDIRVLNIETVRKSYLTVSHAPGFSAEIGRSAVEFGKVESFVEPVQISGWVEFGWQSSGMQRLQPRA